MNGGDFRRRLSGQGKLEFVEQQLQLWLGLCVAREAQFASVGCGHVDIDHVHGCELVQHAARGESRRERFESLPECDVQAVGEKRDEDMRFDARLLLVEDGADR